MMSNDKTGGSPGALPPGHPYSPESDQQMADYADRLAAGKEKLYGTPLKKPVSPIFDRFVAIDWSGARGSAQRGIAIASCVPGETAPVLVEPPRRGWSREDVLDWLKVLAEAGERAIVGLDLSPGLPFVDAGAYFPGWTETPADMPALWAIVDELSAANPHLGVDGFVEAASSYFRRPGQRGASFPNGRGRLRECEQRQLAMRLSPSSCFNLVGAAQVGKSSLTGMRVLHRLGGRIPLWPLCSVPANGPVLVEIYTSLAARAAKLPPGRAKMWDGASLDAALSASGSKPHRTLVRYDDHATDAILSAAWLRTRAHDPALWSPRGLDEVAATEGWTFGVP